MKLLCYSLLFLFTAGLYGQSTGKDVLGTAGITFVNAQTSVGFTIGEPLVGLVSNSESIDQGFWAGSLTMEVVSETVDLDGIFVYPNPVGDELHLHTNGQEVFGITLFSVDGKRVMMKKIDATRLEHTIDFSYISTGMYVLRLHFEDNTRKLFKILKK